MKIEITMKDPDGVYESVRQDVEDSVKALNLSKKETEALIEVRREEIMSKLGKWIEYGEYLNVAFDLEAMTATVVER